MVPLITKRADPDLGSEVDAREGVEDGRASLTSQRRVRERGDIRVRTHRRDTGGEWDHALAGLHLRSRPYIPRHSHSIDSFRICVRHLRHLCLLCNSKNLLAPKRLWISNRALKGLLGLKFWELGFGDLEVIFLFFFPCRNCRVGATTPWERREKRGHRKAKREKVNVRERERKGKVYVCLLFTLWDRTDFSQFSFMSNGDDEQVILGFWSIN